MKKLAILFTLLTVFLFLSQANAFTLTVYVNDSSSEVSGATIFLYNTTALSVNQTNTTNSSGYAMFNLSIGNYTVNVTKDGYYSSSNTINITANATLNITLSEDSVNPIVSLESPVANANQSSNLQTFSFNVSDDLASTLNCSLYIDGSLNQTNSSVLNSTSTSFQTSLSETNHTWMISCKDDQNNEHNASRSFTIDTTYPSLTNINIQNNYVTNETNIIINWTASDSRDTNLSCLLNINGVLNSTIYGNETMQASIDFNSGIYNYTINCSDDADNSNVSSTRTFYVDNNHAPSLSISLSDNITQNNTQVTLSVEVFSYSNISLLNYTIGTYSNNLTLSSGNVKNGTWTATLTLSDNSSYVEVNVLDYYGDTNYGNVSYIIDDVLPTTNVSALTITNTSFASLNLVWTTDNSTYLHKIYRKTSNFSSSATEGTLIATVSSGTNYYNDTSAVAGTNYYYAVLSVDQANNLNTSIYAEANSTSTDSVIPKNPNSLNTSLLSNNAMYLVWNSVSQDIEGHNETGTIRYYVFRSTSASWNTSGNPIINTSNTYGTDNYSTIGSGESDLEGNTYYYSVIAVDYSGNRNTSSTTNANGTVGSECTNDYTYEDWGSCEDGIKTRTGIRYCFGLGYSDNDQTSTESTTCSSNSDDSNDDSSDSDDNTEVGNLLATWNQVEKTGETYNVPNTLFGISKIKFTLTEYASTVNIKLTSHSSKPSSTDIFPVSKFYKFVDIEGYNMPLEKAEIEFFVDNTWLSSQGLDKEDIVLWHYKNLEWIEEYTTWLREEDGKQYYQASTESFSIFAIAPDSSYISTAQEIEDDSNLINDEISDSELNNAESSGFIAENNNTETTINTANQESNNLIIILLIIVIVFTSAGLYLIYFNQGLYKKIILWINSLLNRSKELKPSRKKLSKEVPEKNDSKPKKLAETEDEALKDYSHRDRILKF